MEERKNNFWLGLLIGVLIMLVIGLSAFIIYDKVLSDNESQSGENDGLISLDVSDSVVIEAYDSIMPSWYSHSSDYFYHESDRVLTSDISDEIKMELVLNKWYKDYKNNPDKDVEITNYGDNYIVSEDKIIKVYKQLFGYDTYEFTEYNGICPGAQKLDDGRIEIGLACGGTGIPSILSGLVKAEKNGDELYIYEVAGFLKYLAEDTEDGGLLYNLYRDVEYNVLITERIEYKYEEHMNLLNAYKSKLNTYKYTFKSNGDGTYHFYSVEKQ